MLLCEFDWDVKQLLLISKYKHNFTVRMHNVSSRYLSEYTVCFYFKMRGSCYGFFVKKQRLLNLYASSESGGLNQGKAASNVTETRSALDDGNEGSRGHGRQSSMSTISICDD